MALNKCIKCFCKEYPVFLSVCLFSLLCFVLLFLGRQKQKAFILIHSHFKIIARALLPVCIYLALKTTHHTAIDRRREKRSFLATFTLLRERTNAFGALVFLFLSRSVDNQHPSAVKKEAARISNKKSPPRKTTPFFLLC